MKIEEIASSFGALALILVGILIFADHPERVELVKNSLMILMRWAILIVRGYTTEYWNQVPSGTW